MGLVSSNRESGQADDGQILRDYFTENLISVREEL